MPFSSVPPMYIVVAPLWTSVHRSLVHVLLKECPSGKGNVLLYVSLDIYQLRALMYFPQLSRESISWTIGIF